MANVSGMLIPRYSFQFAQTFALLPSRFSCPSPLCHVTIFEFICRLSKMFTRSCLLKQAALYTPASPHCACPPAPFLGQSLCKTCPKFMKEIERERGSESVERGSGAFKCSSCACGRGRGSGAECLHFPEGRLSIEIMALPVQEKC